MGQLMFGALVLVAGGLFVVELFGRRRSRRVHAALARITRAMKGRRHPELDLEIADLHSDDNAVWILLRGGDAMRVPPHLGTDQLAKLDAPFTGWLRTLNAELKTMALADGWAPRVGFDAAERVAGDAWSYFK